MRACSNFSIFPQRNPPADRPAGRGPVDLRDGHVRGRLALRGRRRPAASRTSPSTSSSRAPSAGRPRANRHGDRRHRRRVQRLHGQGVHGLLRQVRQGARPRRDRRARRHAAALALRSRGDRAREGRDRRGDEHVPRHADELPAGRLRPALLRRHAARPRHHRHARDGARGHARDVHDPPRPLVRAGAHGHRPRRRRHRCRRAAAVEELFGSLPAADSPDPAPWTPRAAPARAHPPQGVGLLPHPRRRRRPAAAAPRPLRRLGARGGARRRHVVAPLHRGARAPRPRVLHRRPARPVRRGRARSSRRPASISSAPTRP